MPQLLFALLAGFGLSAQQASALATISFTVYGGSTDFETNSMDDVYFSAGAAAHASIEEDSSVLSYAGSRPASHGQWTASGDKVLAVDTTGYVERNLLVDGSSQEIPGSIFIDMLVKGTAQPVGATHPEWNNADKIMLYFRKVAQGGSTVTKLFAFAGDGEPINPSQKEYELTTPAGVTISDDAWLRLVVKATDENTFSVYLGGYGDDYLCKIAGSNVSSLPSAGGASADVACVAFTGTGSVDELVFANYAPDASAMTLTWPEGITPVSYTVVSSASSTVAIGETDQSPFTFAIPDDATSVAFTFRNADGATKTVAVNPSEVSTIAAADHAFTWADYLGEAVNGAYEIDDLAELKLFQKGIAITTNELKLATAGETFKLTADIALDAPWPGIGVQNGKDIYATTDFNAAAFQGTFDGQNHTISGFQMIGKGTNPEGLDYCGFFNSTYGATIQNLKIAYAGSLFAADTTDKTKESGATFVGVAKNSTLRNLTTVVGTVSCSKGFGGIVGYLTSGTTVDSCTNNLNMTSLAGNKCGGIAMITQGGSAVTIRNCQNNGTQTTSSPNSEFGAIVGYVGLDTTIADCETTVGRFLKHQGNTVTLQGVNKGDATVLAYHGAATPGLNFATVNGNVATFVADNALALNGTYKVMSSHAAYAFVSEGAITFDESLATPTVNPGAGRKVTKSGEGPYTYMAEALATPTVTVIGGANATAAWTVNGEPVPSAPATLVEGDTYAVVYTANEGFEFEEGATTSAGGTAGTEDISITISDAVAQGGSALDPENGTLEVTVDAESESAAIAAAKEAIAVPSGSSVGKAVYAEYFTYGVTGEGGTYTVTITGIKDTVTAGVYESALDRLTDDSTAAIAVPVGLYYSITPSTALPISGTPATGLSTGSVPVEKPGTTAGFYEIKLSPTPIPFPAP